MKKCIIGAGSNINAKENFECLRKVLPTYFNKVIFSKVIKTKPIGYAFQENFLNAAVLIEVETEIKTTQKQLKKIENQLGRIRTENKNGPRSMDLDILIWDGMVIDENVKKWPFWRKLIKEISPEIKINQL